MRPLLKAVFLLGWSLLVTLIRLAFGRGRSGLAAFRENYAADGISPLTPAQRAEIGGYGGCIACGLCDRGEGRRIAASKGAYTGVMPLVLGASRSMPDFAAAARGFSHVPVEVLADKESICPAQVPIRKIAAFVQAKAGEARTSGGAAPTELATSRG